MDNIETEYVKRVPNNGRPVFIVIGKDNNKYMAQISGCAKDATCAGDYKFYAYNEMDSLNWFRKRKLGLQFRLQEYIDVWQERNYQEQLREKE